MNTRLLRVEGPHFVAGAIWGKEDQTWLCFHAAPILRWMVGKTADEVKHLRGKPGWNLEWL